MLNHLKLFLIPEPPDSSNVSDDRYLMSRFSNTGIHVKHSKLSNMTKQSVSEILENDIMSNCLVSIPNPDMCGDGIVQENEVELSKVYNVQRLQLSIKANDFCQECDCGSVELCLSTRSCCIQAGEKLKYFTYLKGKLLLI